VKTGLQNTKSVLRSQARKEKEAEKQGQGTMASASAVVPAPTTAGSPASRLERLEEQIDECLILAKDIDREDLKSVISLLRRARNEVVWQMGQ
jgi:hypothetical protein